MDKFAAHDIKEQVRQSIDIVDLASGYLTLRRQGRLYVANCPWHDDTRPSLQINPERQTFKCWVCDIGGDVFNFVMRLERLEFREALEMLAEKAGVTLTQADRKPLPPGSPGDKRTLFAAMEWARDLFRQMLVESPEAATARRYLRDRGLSDEILERFHVGFSPNEWEWLSRRARSGPFSHAVLERVGLLGRRANDGGFYDRFKGRVLFPIADLRGRTIAFGGRILPEFADEQAAKYVNSPETPLYNKSEQLFALDMARDRAGKEGEVVVMEGYTDVMMAHQHGLTNAVAVCGTALGERHLRLLKRFTDRIVLLLDGDEAGQRRSNEVLEMFIANQVDLRLLTLPDGLDPCDYLLRFGGESLGAEIKSAVDALEFKLRHVRRLLGPNPSTHAAAEGVEELLKTLAKWNQSSQLSSAAMLRQQQMLGRIARDFHLRELDLRQRLDAMVESPTSLEVAVAVPTESPPVRPVPAVLSLWEREIFELVLSKPALVGPIVESIPLGAMRSPTAQLFYQRVIELHDRHEGVTFDRLLSLASNEAEQNLLVDIDESAQQKVESDADRRLFDLVEAYRKQMTMAAQRQRLATLRDDSLDPTTKDQLLTEYFESLKRRQTGSLSTDG